MTQLLNRIHVCAAVCAFGLSCAPAAEAQPTTTALYFDSQPGDYIGQGEQHTWLPGDLTFNGSFSTPTRIFLRAGDFSFGSTWWDLRFIAPEGAVVAPGTYENAAGGFLASPLRPVLEVSGSGRLCSSVGRFTIYEVAFDGAGNLTTFSADFEQHCSDGVPALFGAIRFNANRSSLLPFDGLYPVFSLHVDGSPFGHVAAEGIDCGADCDETYGVVTTQTVTVTPAPDYTFLAWSGDCSGGVTSTTVVGRRKRCTPFFDAVPGSEAPPPPRTGSVFYVDSQPGEWVGSGQRWLLSSADSKFLGSGTTSHVSFNLTSADGDLWSLAFTAPDGMTLTASAFERATRDPFHSPLTPGLSITGRSHGCNTLRGRFVVYELALGPTGEVQRFAADFEQHCESLAPALIGAIRVNSTRPALIPFDGVYPVYALDITPPVNGRIIAAGIDCTAGGGPDCTQTYTAAGNVSITAAPAPGYVFIGWTGDCEGSPTTTVAIIARHLCGAVFDTAAGGTGPLQDDLRLGSLFFYSQSGDFIGGGKRQVWTRPDTLVEVVPGFGGSAARILELKVTTPDGDYWRLDFAAPGGDVLRVGDFNGATRYPFQAAAVPGLSVSGHGRGCNQLTGRFRIYEVHFDPAGKVDAFAADFEQHCEGGGPALLGAIRFNSTRPSLAPFGVAFAQPSNMWLDGPVDGTIVGRPFTIAGWALNSAAAAGTGVDTVHVYAFPPGGAPPIFLGVAAYGAARPDVGGLFGARFTNCGFNLTAGEGLPPATYLIAAYARNTVTGTFDVAKSATVTIPAPVSAPLTAIDLPGTAGTVAGTFAVAGWSIDRGAPAGTGIDAVHVYAFATGSAVPIFLGVATYGEGRADVGAIFGGRFSGSGYYLVVSNLAPGTYTLVVYSRSTVSGQFTAVSRAITRVGTAMSIDTPASTSLVTQPFLLGGWALDADAPDGPGVDTIHVWAFPAAGGAPIFVGVADYGVARPDVGAVYGSRFTPSGYNLVVTSLPPGTYLLGVHAHSVATGTFNQVRTVIVTIQ